MPLHRLQSYPPGLPDLLQGKWGPQDSSGLAPQESCQEECQGPLDYREGRYDGQLAGPPAADTWRWTPPFLFREGFSSRALGLSFRESLENLFLEEARCLRANFLQGVWA